MDEATTLFTRNPAPTFQLLDRLRPQVLRANLYWHQVAEKKPASPRNPADPAYRWGPYDRLVRLARRHNIPLVLSIVRTPNWANGGKGFRSAPTDARSVRDFAYAAATRYSGRFDPAGPAPRLPRVSRWTAWNEPNLDVFLQPQFQRIGGRKVYVAPRIYARRICTPIWRGVHAAEAARKVARGKVACGVTAPGAQAESPIRFLRGMKAGKARFDVYAHHAHPVSPFQTPTSRPPAGVIGLGNIGRLFRELNRLYSRRVRLWITEYGYQTDPPDKFLGVSHRRQARYLRKTYRIVRRHPRIDMLVWFLLRDEPDKNGSRFGVPGWQSGLIRANGDRKRSFTTFRNLRR